MRSRTALHAATLLALSVPPLMLVSAQGPTRILYLLALVGLLYAWWQARESHEGYRARRTVPHDFWLLTLAFMAPLLAMLVSSAALGQWRSSHAEKLLRFVLALPLAWMLLRVSRTSLQRIQWSLMAGAMAGALLLYLALANPDLGRGAVVAYGARNNAVHVANVVLLLGLATGLLLPWTLSAWPRAEAALKLVVVALAAVSVWLSHTRSSWTLLAIYVLVLLRTRIRWAPRRKLLCAIVLIVVLLGALFVLLYTEAGRFGELATDLQRYGRGDRDSSTGIRLQLWHAAWTMFIDQPWTGVGASGFRDALEALQLRGIVTQRVAAEFGEPHNDFLGALALYGAPGLASMLALYLIPAALFFRRAASPDTVIRVAASIGLLYTLGYALFSTTEMMFRTMRSVPGYAVTVVLLYALANTRPDALQGSGSTKPDR
ncbi:O-antigen ligase family protein [Pseudomonadota bacterium AL_CKDN230030165-1A_HGKHYDSX7]